MRKLVAKIEIYEDNEAMGSATASPDSFIHNAIYNPVEPWVITLAPRESAKVGHDKVDVLAHELGHVVSLISKTPVASLDLDNTMRYKDDRISEYQFALSRYAEEAEAWDIAKVIKPDIPDSTVDYSLKTYKKVISNAIFRDMISGGRR